MTVVFAETAFVILFNIMKAKFKLLFTLLIFTWTSYSFASNSTDYFRSLTSGNWSSTSTWQSSSDNSNWSNATLVPTSSANSIVIQTGHTVTINATATASSITINGTGVLTFDGVAARSLTVTNDLTVNSSNASFITQSSGSYTNTLTISGNIVNNGTFDMSRGGSTLVCNVTFNKNGNQTVSGTGGTTRFNMVTVDMGTSYSNILEISSSNFQTAANFLHTSSGSANQLKNGTIKFSGTYTYSNALFQAGTYYNIVATAGLWINNPNFSTVAVNDSYDLRGYLRISNGTFNVGNSTGNSVKYFTGSVFIMEGGSMNAAGRFYCNSTGQSINCTISGGTMTLCTVGSNSASSKFASFQISTTSTFTWSGGIIVLQQGQNFYGGMDYSDASSSASITGGTLQICNSNSTGGVSEFYLYSINPIGNLTLLSTNSPTVYMFSTLTVNGNITIGSGATIDSQADPNAYNYEVANPGTTVYSATDSYDINIKGHWVNNGSFLHRSKTVTFNGTSSEDISGTTETNYYNLTINNASGVTITQGPLVSNVLTFTQGNVFASSISDPIILETSGSSIGQADGKCVVGYCQKNTNSTSKFTFPVGSVTYYRSIAITPSGNGATSWLAKYFQTSYSDLSVTDITSVTEQEYWTLDRSGASPVNATIELSWAPMSGLTDISNIVVAHYNGSDWHDAGGNNITGNASSGTVSSDPSWSNYSPFTLGFNGIPLPTELILFDAKKQDENVLIYWETVNEIDLDYFEVEKSDDAIHFETITMITSKGNSQFLNKYEAVDREKLSRINYYRLKQIDINGNVKYSKIISVSENQNMDYVKTINTLGQEVDQFTKGVVYDIYTDGSLVKKIQ